VTVASGDVSDTIGRPVDNGQLGLLDPECRCIGLHLYDGLLKVVPLDPGTGTPGPEAFSARLEELNVIDAAFLAGCPTPTVALLYEDAKHARHIKTYCVGLRSKVCVGERGWLGGAGRWWGVRVQRKGGLGDLLGMARGLYTCALPPGLWGALVPRKRMALTPNRTWRRAPWRTKTSTLAPACSSRCPPPSAAPSSWGRAS
jgi:hypothetical protein